MLIFTKYYWIIFSNPLTTISVDSSKKQERDFSDISGLSYQLRVWWRKNLEFCTIFFDLTHQFSKNVRLRQVLQENRSKVCRFRYTVPLILQKKLLSQSFKFGLAEQNIFKLKKFSWIYFTLNKCHYYWQSHDKVQRRHLKHTVEKGLHGCMTVAKMSLKQTERKQISRWTCSNRNF